MEPDRSVRARGLAATAALVVGYLSVSGLLAWGTAGAVGAVREPGPASVDAALALAAAAGGWLVLSWLTALTVLTVLTAAVAGLGSRAHRRAAALAPRGLPPAGRRPARAHRRGRAARHRAAGRRSPAGLGRGRRHQSRQPRRRPARPRCRAPRVWTGRPPAYRPAGRRTAPPCRTGRTPAAAPSSGSSPAPRGPATPSLEEVVVRRGDSLWDIAARHLGADASAAEIATEWPRWHAANAAVIGPDPDLLLPGQRLLPPHPMTCHPVRPPTARSPR